MRKVLRCVVHLARVPSMRRLRDAAAAAAAEGAKDGAGKLGRRQKLVVTVYQAARLRNPDPTFGRADVSDPYVVLRVTPTRGKVRTTRPRLSC